MAERYGQYPLPPPIQFIILIFTFNNLSVAKVKSIAANGTRELTTLGIIYCCTTATLTFSPSQIYLFEVLPPKRVNSVNILLFLLYKSASSFYRQPAIQNYQFLEGKKLEDVHNFCLEKKGLKGYASC